MTGVGVWLLGRRRRPELVAYAVACLVVVGGWFTYTVLVPEQLGGSSYGVDVVAGLGGAPDTHPVFRLIQSAWNNLLQYGLRTLPTELSMPTVGGTIIDNIGWLGANTVLISVGTFVLWKRSRAAAAYLVFYGVLLLAWPWVVSRLLIPFVPLAMLALLVGAYHLTRALPAPARDAVIGTLVLLLGFGGIKDTVQRDERVRKCDLADPYQSEGCMDRVTRGVGRAALFLRDHSPPDAVVLTLKAPGVNYVSGRLTELPSILSGVPAGQAHERLRNLKIQYVLLSGRNGTMVNMARALLPSCPELWVVRRFATDVTLLTTAASGGGSEDACTVLSSLVNPDSTSQEH